MANRLSVIALCITAALPIFGQSSSTSAPAANFERPISLKLLLPNIADDQVHIYTFPEKLKRKRTLLPTLAILGATAGLIALDGHDAPYFRKTGAFHGFNQGFSSTATQTGILLTPVAFYLGGLLAGDSKAKNTALLSAESLADVEILVTVLKVATRRERPRSIAATGNFNDSFYDSGGAIYQTKGSFPSGHSIAAFAVATVISRRYGNHKWVPYVCYGAAALIGFSRVSLSAHYISDVFLGGALGYSVSRFAVLR